MSALGFIPFFIVIGLAIPLLLLFFVIRFVFGIFRHRGGTSVKSEWHLMVANSREDAVSQAFFFLSFLSLCMILLHINQELDYLLSSQTIFLISSIVGLAGAYWLKNVYLLVGSLAGVTLWWGAQAALWASERVGDIALSSITIVSGIGLITLLFYALGRLHEWFPKAKRFALTYLVLGVVPVTALLFFLSTGIGLEALEDMTRGTSMLNTWQVLFSFVVIGIALVVTLTVITIKRLIYPGELAALIVLVALLGSIAFLPAQTLVAKGDSYSYSRTLTSTGIIWASIFNIALLAELVGIVFMGYARRATGLINLGALALFIFIFIKYFDWFFSYINKSVFFIGAGVLLFALGWLMERGRRRMIATLKSTENQPSTL